MRRLLLFYHLFLNLSIVFFIFKKTILIVHFDEVAFNKTVIILAFLLSFVKVFLNISSTEILYCSSSS